MTESHTVYIVYLAILRLSVVVAGTLCIYFGYRLFARNITEDSNTESGPGESNLEARFAGAAVTLKNAAPGTSFALFGAIIIVAVFLSGPPGVTLESLENGRMKATFRGDNTADIRSASNRALEQLSSGNRDEAVGIVESSLKRLAPALNNMAWVLFKTESKWPKTILLADIAVALEPENHHFLHTLAELQFQNGLIDKSITTLEKAGRIAPYKGYSEQVKQWREQK